MLRRPPGQSGRAGTTRIFLSGQAVSLLGDGLAVLTVPLLVLGLTRNPLAVAASAAPASVGYLLVGLPAGVIVDRLSPWRVLIAADLVRATAFGVLYVLAVAGGLHVWLVLALVFLAGTARAFFDTALAVAVQDMFEVPALVRANASLELATQLSSVLGPGMVGVLAGFGGITIALLLNAGTFVISLVSLVIVSGDRHRSLPRSPAALPWRVLGQEFGQGVRYLLKNKLILTLTALQMVINLCLAADKLVVFYAKDTLQLTATLVSLVLVGGGVGGVLGAMSAAKLAAKIGRIRLVAIAAAATGVSLVAMSAANSVATLTATQVTYVWALVVASLVIRSLRQEIVPRDLLGRVSGTVRTLFLTVVPLGVLITGSLTSLLGNDPRPVFLGCGLVIAMSVAAAWLSTLRRWS
jgi:MFS family permease